MRNRIDPRLAEVLELLSQAEGLIDSGRTGEGLEKLRHAATLLAGFMDLDLDEWREQSEFLP